MEEEGDVQALYTNLKNEEKSDWVWQWHKQCNQVQLVYMGSLQVPQCSDDVRHNLNNYNSKKSEKIRVFEHNKHIDYILR